MTLAELIVESSKSALNLQDINGAMPSGHNGPYFDEETPVRNTSHWIITFLKAYTITGDSDFLDAAIKAGDYLLSKEARPMDKVFFCRKNPRKDFANGLVGQAWTIEALVELSQNTQTEKYRMLAEKVFLMHPYNFEYAAWIRRNVDGSLNGFDKTFNHELWFAAAGSLLSEFNQEIDKQVNHFLNNIDKHVEIFQDGCIKHMGYFLVRKKEEFAKEIAKTLLKSRKERKFLRYKSIGYHSFNTYALGMINKSKKNIKFWNSKKFKHILEFVSSDKYQEQITTENKFGFPYNPPGFEVTFTSQQFNLGMDITWWVSKQINFGLNKVNYLLTENSPDPCTSAARLYEVTRLNNIDIKIDR
jgi:uncharacterized protein YyaL (SSP411 family)